MKDLERYMGLSAERPAGELLYQFLTDSGWLGRMTRASTAREEAEVQNVAEFFRRIQDATRPSRRDHVREFVTHLDALIEAGDDPAVAEADVEVRRGPGADGPQGQGAGVSGGVRGGAGPGPVSLAEPRRGPGAARRPPPGPGRRRRISAVQEERRLFYVAMTRAREALHPDVGARLRGPEHAKGQPVRPGGPRSLARRGPAP